MSISEDLPLRWRSFAMTGVYPGYTRDQLRRRIQDLGGIVEENVRGGTNWLIVGERPGKGKLDAARNNYNTRLIDPRNFESMCRGKAFTSMGGDQYAARLKPTPEVYTPINKGASLAQPSQTEQEGYREKLMRDLEATTTSTPAIRANYRELTILADGTAIVEDYRADPPPPPAPKPDAGGADYERLLRQARSGRKARG